MLGRGDSNQTKDAGNSFFSPVWDVGLDTLFQVACPNLWSGLKGL